MYLVYKIMLLVGPWYLHFRLLRYLWPAYTNPEKMGVWARRCYWLCFFTFFGFFAAVVWKKDYFLGLSPAWREVVFFVLSFMVGGMLLVLMFTAFRDAILLIQHGWQRYGKKYKKHTSQGQSQEQQEHVPHTQDKKPQESRRRFLLQSSWAVVGLSGADGAYGYHTARGAPKIVEVKIPLGQKAGAFTNYVIAQLSDIHIGRTIKTDFVESVVEKTNQIGADIIVLTGDIFDDKYENIQEFIKPLEKLRAKDGVFFILGNHEYYHGDVNPFIKAAQEMGMIFLRNENYPIKRGDETLWIIGLDDKYADAFDKTRKIDPALGFQGTNHEDEQKPPIKVVLAHRPTSEEDLQGYDADLQLSGHTHGGQMWPGPIALSLVAPYIAGLYRVRSMWLYVTAGTGYWGPPLRIGVPPEVTRIILTEDTINA